VSFYDHVSSVIVVVVLERFVTARAIDLKLCTYYVPPGHITYQTKFQSDLILNLATKGPKLKTQKSAITPEQMIGSSSNF
jgi:hypothetical protein